MKPLPGSRAGRQDTLVCLFLATVVLLLFWRVTGYGLIYDDDSYVTAVPQVLDGLTLAGIRWAFTTTHAEFWHPLTWLSLMLDRQFFGPGLSGFHFSALLLHLLNTLLLYLAGRRLIGHRGASILTALLFAIHPLHVQTVAWIADRKDVLAAFFCLLFLLCYRAYAARPGPARYLLALVAFAIGLMAKPSLVTLPVALLLLDWWPLGRLGGGRGAVPVRRLFVEKIPFLALALAMTAVGYWAEARAEGVASLAVLSLRARVTNAIVSYVEYLRLTVWPTGLAAFYPHPRESIPLSQAALSLIFLVVLTGFAGRQWRRRPHLVVGWLWFVGMLLPVIGLVQVGNHAMADRYTYLPHIGLFLAAAWGLSRLLASRPALRAATLYTVPILLVALSAATWREVGYWKDGPTLYRRALAVTRDNWFMHLNLGLALLAQDRPTAAEEQFRALLRINRSSPWGHQSLALALAAQGRMAEAELHARENVRLAPRDAEARNYLAWILSSLGNFPEAEALCREAISLNPGFTEAYVNLGVILASQGRRDEGMRSLGEALRLDPANRQASALLERLRRE